MEIRHFLFSNKKLFFLKNRMEETDETVKSGDYYRDF